MASLLVRLNLPGFSSPEPFYLAAAPQSLSEFHCAVLKEIGGFSQKELQDVRENQDSVPFTLLGELCDGELVELSTNGALEVFLATAESPAGYPTIEVRPNAQKLQEVSPQTKKTPLHPNPELAVLSVQTNQPKIEETQLQEQLLEQQLQIAKLTQQLQREQQTQLQQLVNTSVSGLQPTFAGKSNTNVSARRAGTKQSENISSFAPTSVRAAAMSAADASPGGGDATLLSSPALLAAGLPQACISTTPDNSLAHSPAGSQLAASSTFISEADAPFTNPGQPTQPSPRPSPMPSPVQPVQSSALAACQNGRFKTPEGRRKGFGQRAGQGAATRNSSAPWDSGTNGRGRGHNLRNSTGQCFLNQSLVSTALDSSQIECDGAGITAPIVRQHRDRDQAAGRTASAPNNPVQSRLCQDREERKRRHEEARQLKTEQEEEIRVSARHPFRGGPSPRARNPEPQTVARQAGAGTPPRQRPGPVTARRSGPGGVPIVSRKAPTRNSNGGMAPTSTRDQEGQAAKSSPATAQAVVAGTQTSAPISFAESPSRRESPQRRDAHAETGLRNSSSASVLAGGSQISAPRSFVESPNRRESPHRSESGARLGVRNTSSTNLLCLSGEQASQLNITTDGAQIEFIEAMHQQALRQLKRTREELAIVQQQRFHEADKALKLQQLISEMQIVQFDMDPKMQARWQEWMQRSRAILEAE